MLKKYLFYSFVFYSFLSKLSAQNYFQQKVNTSINVTLNDELHELNGDISMDYTNQSNENLNEIYFLLYPNAFNGSFTKFAKQQLDNGSTKFHFSKPEQQGSIDGFQFVANDKKVEFLIDPENNDIGKIILNEPLKKGETIQIKTPFRVKIPNVFSRFGHEKNYYACTQWFPKPAVFDAEGWHKYPYLDMGEFYYEYGTYDVRITLPNDYIVAATGELQNKDELSYYKLLSQGNVEKTNSSNATKTLQFKAENVHDFAWFASKDFKISYKKMSLKSGRNVDLWGFYQNENWKKSTDYIEQALNNYGNWVGEYPHPQCSAVEGPLKAGGGMEYPMVTIIDSGIDKPSSLQSVIVHEVGHNWFQGILGSDERKFPWLDEGLNTFYEHRTIEEVNKNDNSHERSMKIGVGKFSFNTPENFNIEQLGLRYLTALNKTQAQKLSSEKYTQANYGLLSYSRTGNVLQHLMHYLGETQFDKCMQQYFEKWKFKHPQPKDLKKVFEEVSGKDLSWFFDNLLTEKEKVDIKIVKADESGIVIQNKGKSPIPAFVSAIDENGKVIQEKSSEIIFPGDKLLLSGLPQNAIAYNVDYHNWLNETNENNNVWRSKGLFKRGTKYSIKPFISKNIYENNNLYFAPALAYSAWNKFMLGALFYNRTIMPKNFEFQVAPMYSFATKTLTGGGTAKYYYHPYNDKNIREIAIGIDAKTFGHGEYNVPENNTSRLNLAYYKVSPKIEMTLANSKKNDKTTHKLYYQFDWIENEYYSGKYLSDSSFSVSKVYQHYHYNTLGYQYVNPNVLSPMEAHVRLQGNEIVVKTDVEFKIKPKVKWNKQRAKVRLFGGLFLYRKPISETDYDGFFDSNLNFRVNGTGANNDLTYDRLFFARNIDRGFWSNQIYENDGFMKINTQLQNTISTARNFMTAINVTVPIPRLPVIHVYGDAIFYMQKELPYDAKLSSYYFLNFGVAAKVVPDVFEIYFPVFTIYNKDNLVFHSVIKGTKYKDLISFRLELQKLNLLNSARKIDF